MIMVRFLFCALCAILFFPIAMAAEGPTWVTALQVRVHPGMGPQYEQLVRRFIEANDKLETDFYWSASSIQYGPAGSYTFARWHDSTATLQANPRNVIAEAFGEEAAREWAAGIAETLAESQTGVWMERPDLSLMPPEDMVAVNLLFLQVVIEPFGNEAYEEYLQKSAEASRAIEPTGYYTAHAPVWGAENTYAFVTPLPNLGELGPPPSSVPERIIEHFGEREGKRLLDARLDLVVTQQSVLSNLRPDLSRPPPE